MPTNDHLVLHAAVEIATMNTVGKAISADSASSLLDSADAIAFRDQIGREPQQQPEIDQAEADRGRLSANSLPKKRGR